MQLNGDLLKQYIDEIHDLYRKYLKETPISVTSFGIINGSELEAIASVKCYSGYWYLRGCVVKPEYRGNGLQRKLITERLEYLAKRTDTVRVSVFPWNMHSINNIEAEGFAFEKKKILPNKETLLVYKREL